MISKSFASLATCVLPLVSLSAQQAVPAAVDPAPVSTPAAVADSGKEISFEANMYLMDGSASSARFVRWMDDTSSFLFNFIVMMEVSGMDSYTYAIPDAPKASGEMYGFTLAYGLEKTALGRFSFEMDYRGGTVDDSQQTLFSGSSDVMLTSGPAHITVNGSLSRSFSMDTDKVALLALWHPKGWIGDYLGVGIAYSNESVSTDYTMTIQDVSKTGDEPESAQSSVLKFGSNYDVNNILLHARIGGGPLPWLTFAKGKFGFIPRADLALGYSRRNLKQISYRTVSDGVLESDTSISAKDMMINDTGVFEGTARLSFYYNLACGQIMVDAGYQYDAEFGRYEGGDMQGFCGGIGYKYNW